MSGLAGADGIKNYLRGQSKRHLTAHGARPAHVCGDDE